MSRKARDVEKAQTSGKWASAHILAANLGFSPVKHLKFPPHVTVVLWLPDAMQTDATTMSSRLGPILPAVQRILMATDTDTNIPPPGAIFIIDCTPLIPTGSKAQWILDKEAKAGPQPGKQLGKPVGRLLEKLLSGHRGSVTLVGVDGGASLALCLLQALPAEHGIKDGAISRVVLLRPSLSAAVVNAYLTQSQTKLIVDVVYGSRSALDRREVAVRHAYPKGTSRVLDALASGGLAAVGGALYSSSLLSGSALESSLEAEIDGVQLDPDASDALAQTVFWSEISFEMSRDTKQTQALASEIDVHELAEEISASVVAAASSRARTEDDVSQRQRQEQQQQWVGALLLRGNRCVLVRSLESPPAWKGMRLPTVALRLGEAEADGAIRAAAEYCDIEPSELERMPSVAPVSLHLDEVEGEGGHATIYPLYAARPPPPGCVLEDADLTDEDDLYDWYTWPRAMYVLRHDARATMALRTFACALAAAVDAGKLALKWGGYFGQEWLGTPTSNGVSQLLPKAPPLPTATVDMLQTVPTAMMPQRAVHAQDTHNVSQRLTSLEAKIDQLLSSVASGRLAES